MADLPSFQDYLNAGRVPPAPQSAVTPTTPPATGTGNWLTSGLGSGFYGTLSDLGKAGQAVAQATGFDDAAQAAKDFAARQQATAQTYANPQYVDHPWSLGGMGYQLAQGVPAMAGMIGAGALATLGETAAAPAEAVAGAGLGLRALLGGTSLRGMLGAGAAAYPLAVGANVDRAEEYQGDLSQSDARKALLYGVPEAAAQSILPAGLEHALGVGVGGTVIDRILSGAKTGAIVQGGVGALTEVLTQQMGDPNRAFADRAQSVVQSALGGAFQGAVFGGALHALAKQPVPSVTENQLKNAVDESLSGALPPTQPTNPVGSQQLVPATPRPPLVDTTPPAPPEPEFVPTVPDPTLAQRVQSYVRNTPDEELAQQYNDALKRRDDMSPGQIAIHDMMGAELQRRLASRDAQAPEPTTIDQTPVAPASVQETPPTPASTRAEKLVKVFQDIAAREKEVQDATSQVQTPVETQASEPAPVETQTPEPAPVETQTPASDQTPFDWQAIKKDNPRLPKSIANQDIQSMDQLKQVLAEHIDAKDADPRGLTPSKTVLDLATKIGAVDEKGQTFTSKAKSQAPAVPSVPASPVPQAPIDMTPTGAIPPVEAPQPVKRAPPKDTTMSAGKQAIHDMAERARSLGSKISADPDYVMQLNNEADRIQSGLRNATRGGDTSVQSLGKAAKKLLNDATSRSEARPPEVTPKNDDYYTKPVEPTAPPTPKVLEDAQKVPRPKEDVVPPVSSVPEKPVETKTQRPKNQQEVQAQKDPNTLAQRVQDFVSSKTKRTAWVSDIRKAFPGEDVEKALEELHNRPDNGFRLKPVDDPKQLRGQGKAAERRTGAMELKGKPLHVAEQRDVVQPSRELPKTLTPLERVGARVKAARESLGRLMEQAKTKRPEDQETWDSALDKQDEKLLELLQAVKDGDIEKLKGIPENYLQNADLDNRVEEKLDTPSQNALQRHYGLEDDVLQEIRRLAGSGPKPELVGEKPATPVLPTPGPAPVRNVNPPLGSTFQTTGETTTQHEIDLTHFIHNTNDTQNGQEVFKYLSRNGSNAQVRELADILVKSGANPKIRLGGLNDVAFQRLQKKFSWARVDATYEPKRNAIAIHTINGSELKLLHEGVHAATERALVSNSPAAQRLRQLYDYAKTYGSNYKELGKYGMYDVHEFVAEGLSNPKFQRYLMGLEAPKEWGVRSMWEAFKNAVAQAIGITPTTRSVFDALVDVAHDVFSENQGLEQSISGTARASIDEGMHETADGSKAIYRRAYDAMARVASGAPIRMTEGFRRQALGWMTSGHIAQVWGKLVPALKSFVALQHHDSVRSDTFAKHAVKAFMGLQKLTPEVRHQVERLMSRSVQNIDPRFQWNDQPWLHNSKNAAVLQREVAQAYNDWNNLKRKYPEAAQAYEDARLSNEADRHRHMALFARDMIRTSFNDGVYEGFENDPFSEYERRRDLHDDPAKAANYWQEVTSRQMVGLVKLKNQLSGDYSTRDAQIKDKTNKLSDEDRKNIMAERARLGRNYDTVKSMIDQFNAANKRASQGVYFHLGRNGSHFVAGHIAVDPVTNEINSENAQALSERMQRAGFDDAAIMKGVENTSVYVRVANADEMARLRQVFLDAQRDGILAKSTVDADGNAKARPVEAGMSDATNIYNAISPVWMKRLIEAAREAQPEIPEGVDDKTRDMMIAANAQQMRDLTRTMLNMTPENSISRIYAHRENVQGFSKHMIQNFQTSAVANARGTSRLSLAEDMAQAMQDMKDQVRANNGNATYNPNQILGGAQAAAEMIMREKNRETIVPATIMDGVRQMTHTFQVGSSPTYMFTLMTQIPTLSLPELAKTHGFANSALALGRAAPEAFKILKAVWSGDDWSRFGMRQENLEKAGLSQEAVDFHMKHAMMGDYHHSSYTQAMTGHGPLSQGRVGKITTAANALGLYSEMMPRVLTAIAARELYKNAPEKARGMSMDDFVSEKVSGSQMDWAPSGNARQTTRQGMFGAMSPLINQFMGFQIRLTEKLYREVADAYGQGRTPEERAQAKRFLLGHAAAVTMFAGTLGFPMLGTAAAVYDRLKDWIMGEDNNDVIASYRSFLVDAFGKETGEVIARGLPRAFGADFDHIGEGRIAPGSAFVNFMMEKRSLEDAEKDWLKSEAGSATGFLFNIAAAARSFSNGDIMDGWIKLAPEALKSPSEAWRIAERGFVDKNGQQLPITADAFDIAMKAVGIDPAKEAEYDEVKRTQTGLNTMRQLREKNITQHLVLAANRHDPEMMQSWLAESQKYAQDHPGMLPPAAMFSRAMQKSAQQGAIARGLGLPIGENIRDMGTRGMVGYGNFRNQ